MPSLTVGLLTHDKKGSSAPRLKSPFFAPSLTVGLLHLTTLKVAESASAALADRVAASGLPAWSDRSSACRPDWS